jgi:hypothetical protein
MVDTVACAAGSVAHLAGSAAHLAGAALIARSTMGSVVGMVSEAPSDRCLAHCQAGREVHSMYNRWSHRGEGSMQCDPRE